jgi:hypothetical protein
LLWFEGKEYRLAAVSVAVPSGRSCRALVFFPVTRLPSNRDGWHYDAWAWPDRLAYAARAKRWMAASLPKPLASPHRHCGVASKAPAGGRT